jgi:hypothetical protein
MPASDGDAWAFSPTRFPYLQSLTPCKQVFQVYLPGGGSGAGPLPVPTGEGNGTGPDGCRVGCALTTLGVEETVWVTGSWMV